MRSLLLRILLSFLCLWSLSLNLIELYGQADRAAPADVIVVLGAQVRRGGPGPTLARRTQHAAALYTQGLAANLLCTGGLGTRPPTEASAACDLAVSLGVPVEAVVLEENSHSTEENALHTAAIMRERGWRTAILVTDDYHLFRATMLFERAGITVFASPARSSAGRMRPLESFFRVNRELAALAWYWGKTALGIDVTDFDRLGQ